LGEREQVRQNRPRVFPERVAPFTVQTVEAGEAGSLVIALEEGYNLEIFPHDSEGDEHWRFFKPQTEEPHFVVTGKRCNVSDRFHYKLLGL